MRSVWVNILGIVGFTVLVCVFSFILTRWASGVFSPFTMSVSDSVRADILSWYVNQVAMLLLGFLILQTIANILLFIKQDAMVTCSNVWFVTQLVLNGISALLGCFTLYLFIALYISPQINGVINSSIFMPLVLYIIAAVLIFCAEVIIIRPSNDKYRFNPRVARNYNEGGGKE